MNPIVHYRLACTQPARDTLVTEVKVGDTFGLVLYVQDVRPDGLRPNGERLFRGVFAAYCDVLFRDALVAHESAVSYQANWRNNVPRLNPGEFLPNRLAKFGAIWSGPWISHDLDPAEVCSVRLRAQLPAGINSSIAAFHFDFSQLIRPAFNTLVFGNFDAVPMETGNVLPEEVTASGCMLTIHR